VSFGGTVQDITERKERQEKEHLLMREINHRAKNMLSVVDSIAHQTAARSPEDFIERFSAGTVDLDYAPSGITWRMRCPATNVFEAG
jgi:HWE histidine kinase